MALLNEIAPGVTRYVRIGMPRTQARMAAQGRSDGVASVSAGATLEVYLYIYASRAKREEGAAPLATRLLSWPLADAGLLQQSAAGPLADGPAFALVHKTRDELYAIVYDLVRSLPEFSGSEDELTFSFT